jgi:hypothetical protein
MEPSPATPLDETSLATWLVARVAELLDEPPAEIDIDQPLEHSGLESSDVVLLMIDLSDLFGEPVSPLVLWDHPTIRLASQFLAAVARGEAELPDDLLDLDFG